MQTDGGLLYSQIENQLPGFVQQNHTQFSKFVEKYYEFLELNLLTFTDLDLNEDSIIQESANTIYTVTVATGNNVYSNSANKFYIDDAVSPTLTLTTGTYAIFDQGDETNDTHYFRISTTPNGIHTAGGLEYVTDDRGDTLVTYEGTPADLDNIILETGTNGGGILLYEDETEIGYEIAPRVIFYVSPDLAGKSLYYYCNNHSGMGGNISVSNVTSYMVLDNGNTDSSNTSTDQVNLENPTRQGDQFLSGEIILGANSGATGVVRGKFSNTQVYLEETNNGSFQTGESIEGLTSRVTATVNNYSRQPLNASRNVKGFQDIDKAPKGFVELFRKEFLDGIPTSILADKDRILKNVKDFYRAKGNEASYQYIFRLLYDKQDVSFYYPSTDILRLSDGRWTLDKSLKIETAGANNITAFLGRTIQGGVTNVFALVERTETYQVGATSITELFLSGIDANNAAYNANTDSNYTTFNVNEKISTTTEDDDGNIGSANTTGVLASVSIDAGGSNYSVGDDLLITGGGGSEAAAKVGAVSDATISSIDIIDSGDGYTVGDTVSFINEGTGGTGGAARVQTIVKTAQVFTQTEIINSFKDDLLSASGFTDPWTSFTVNTHISSNSTTTFTVPFDGLSGDTPKSGDFIAKFGSGESITSYTPGGSKFGSVITANSTSITYALGSLNLVRNSLQAHSADPIANNFTNDDSVTIFDLTKDSSGSAKSANGHNAAFVATGGTFNINGTPTANTDTTYHGAGTFTESNVGGIRSIQVLSSGQGYTSSPVVSVANTEIEAYNAAEYVVGANSTFVNLANSIANTFTSNTIVKNASNSAVGIVLDFIDANTDLVATGNTTLRIQMTTAADFSPADVLTAYNRSDNSPVGIGDFGTANVSSDGVTATFTQADHGFEQGDRIVVSGASGTDTAVYNNNHTIDSVTNTSTYVVTLPSDPTDNDKDSVTVRLINTANVAYERMLTEDSAETQIQLESNGFIIVESGIDESNAIFANTGVPGNNAIIQISQIAIGAIQSVVVSNFGAGFTSAPTINASAKGDGNATLTGNLGALAEYEGYFDGNYGLLSTTNKLQDNYYYQDFSYVIKTDVDVATYRDKIIELVHPAGMALFGEVSMIANTSARLFNDATNNVETVIANTTHGIDVPLYRHRDIEIMSVNAENVQVNTTSTLMKPNLFPPTANRAIDAKIDTTGASFEFDVQLEHGHDLISLEIAESIFVYENSGEILLEQDIGGGVGDRLIGETSDILVGEDDSLIIQENTEEVGFHIATESRDQFGISFDDGSILLDGVIDSAKDPFFELDGVNDGRTIKGNSRHGIFLEDTDGVILDEVEVGNGDEHRILFGRAIVAGFQLKLEGDLTGGFLVLDSTDGAPGTDEGGKIDIDGLVIDGHQIVMEDGTGAIVLNSTDGAPASDENDNIITEDYEYSEGTGADSFITEDFEATVFTDADDGKILLEHADGFIVSENYEDGDDVGVLLEDNSEGRLVSEDASDAVVLLEAQNDVDDRLMLEDGEMLLSENTVEHNTFLLANVITAGGRIQEDGPEGQLILQEDESFTLSEDYEEENDTEDGFRQIRLEDNQFLLSEDQPVPYFQDGHIDTNVEFLEMEKGEAVENVYVELEQSDGNGISVRPEFLTRFVLEEDSTDMVKILDEVSGTDNFQHEEFYASLVQEESDSIQLERSDGLLITEDNDGIQLEEADSTTDPTPAFFLFENDDADARGYVLTEPELVSSHIVSENDADTFVIRMEQDGTFFFIRQESELGADFGDFILLEDVGTSDSDYDGSVSTEGRLMGFTNPTSRPDRMSLEKDEYIEDTNLKGEHYEPGTGFFLPKLQFPLAETGASKIDFSFTSNLLIEIDSIDVMTFDGLLVAGGAIELEDHTSGNDDGRAQLLIDSFDGGSLNENDRIVTEDFEMESFGVTGILGDVLQEDGESKILAEVQVDTPEGYIYDLILLEESDGINPMYIALEDSMTEEVDVGTELELLLVDDDHQLHLESGGVLLHENGGIGLEDSVDNVRLESSEGMLLQEDGISVIVFESGSQDGDNFANVILAEDNSKIFLEDSLNDVVEISEPVKASATVKAGVILTDTGHTLNEGNFQVQGTGRVQLRGAGSFELLDEDGNHLVAEQSSDTFKNFTTESDNPYILEQSSGIDTSFLVSDILVEEAESIRFISASYLRQNDAIGTDTKFESEFSAVIILEAETGVVLLEEGTSQDNLICQENSDDKIFEPIQIEESGTLIGNLAAEDDFQKDTARLVLNDLHDLILEEEAIALEEEDHILQEDFTSGDAIKSLLTEGGDNLVLQHADHNLATEEIIGLDNFVQEDRTIDSFTPLLGLEPDNLSGNGGTMDDQGQIPPNIVLEDGTNKTENLCIVMEDTIINSAGGRIGYEDTDGNEESHVLLEDDTGGKVVTEDFFRVTELGEFVVQEGDGVSKIVQEEFYYKQWSEGQIQQTGTTVTIASGRLPHGIHEGGQLRYANGLHTKITSMGSLNEEFEVENSATISTAQNYRILYGVDDTAYNKEVFVSLELNTLSSSGANDAGRQYQFTPDGIVGHEDLDGLGTFTLTPFLLDQRHGNDIVYEDGERILHEDGELTQDENVILLEVNDVLILEDSTNENHNSLLLETGGEIFLEETNQDSEFKLSMESNDVVMLENPVSSFDFRLLNMDGARFRIGLISNSTFMTVDSTETFFERPDSPIIIERAERIV